MHGLTITSQAPEWALPFVQLSSETRISPDEARRYALELLEHALIAEINAFLIQEGSDHLPIAPKAMVRELAELRNGQATQEARASAQVQFIDDGVSHSCSVQEAWAIANSILKAAVLAEQETLLATYAGDRLKLDQREINSVLSQLDAYRRTLPGSRLPEIATKQSTGARVNLGSRFRQIVKSTLQSLRFQV